MTFSFGRNWQKFVTEVTPDHVQNAGADLKRLLRLEDLTGKRFLDIGCGSGIVSLAARRLGASVHSFDFDPHSVAASQSLRDKFLPGDPAWRIERGSVLDPEYLSSLGRFDIVYSWGVLHHTGNMRQALENALIPLQPDGLLAIAIYNDQGVTSQRWLKLKERYNRSGALGRKALELATFAATWGKSFVADIVRVKPLRTIRAWREYSRQRGMRPWRDIVDWAGGFPFEVATPEAILDFYRPKGLVLEAMKTCGGGKGCNEFLFRRVSHP